MWRAAQVLRGGVLFRRSNLLYKKEIASGEEQERPRNDVTYANCSKLTATKGSASSTNFSRAGRFSLAQPLDIFIAGDDADAKSKVSQLVTDGGMRAIDAGPLHRARQIESMQLLHITLQGTLGTNWGSSIKVLG